MEFSQPFLVYDWSIDVYGNFDFHRYLHFYFLFYLDGSVDIDRLIDIDRLVYDDGVFVNWLIDKDLLFNYFRNFDLFYYNFRNFLFNLNILRNFDYFLNQPFRPRYILGNLNSHFDWPFDN
jgi:hypothetical protein